MQVSKNKKVAMFATLLLSAFVHEHAAVVCLHFASVVMIVQFAGLGGELHIFGIVLVQLFNLPRSCSLYLI